MVVMSNEEYHAHPALGSSSLKQLLKSPYKFFQGIKINQTKAMVIGSTVHKLVLEPQDFDKEFIVCPKFDLRTNNGKFAKAQFEEMSEGKTIIDEVDFEVAKSCAKALLTQAKPFLSNGVAEMSFFAELDGVEVKCRPDYLIKELGIVADVKVVEDASPDAFTKSVANFGYYLQSALYKYVLGQNGIEVNKFLFIAVEKSEPNMIGIYELSHVAEEFGLNEARRAIELYKRPDDFSKPLYKNAKENSAIQTLELPTWVFYSSEASY